MEFLKSTISPIWYAPGTFFLWLEFKTESGTYAYGATYPSMIKAELAAINAEFAS